MVHLHAEAPRRPRCRHFAGVEAGKVDAATFHERLDWQWRSASLRLQSDMVHKVAAECARRSAQPVWTSRRTREKKQAGGLQCRSTKEHQWSAGTLFSAVLLVNPNDTTHPARPVHCDLPNDRTSTNEEAPSPSRRFEVIGWRGETPKHRPRT